MYNLYNFEADFKKFLQNQKLSSTTLRNYLSDFRHFWGWFLLTLKKSGIVIEQQSTQIITYITDPLCLQYKSFLTINNIPKKTINRRLSSLRKFIQYCKANNWIKNEIEFTLTNVPNTNKSTNINTKLKSDILDEFYQFLQSTKVSPATCKNYLADIRHFLNWTEENTVQK